MSERKLICQVCKQDHHNKNNIRFCDRSDLEIAYDDLKAKYQKAVSCLRRAQKIIRDDFHNDVCLKSMGCHCKVNFIDKIIAELGEKE